MQSRIGMFVWVPCFHPGIFDHFPKRRRCFEFHQIMLIKHSVAVIGVLHVTFYAFTFLNVFCLFSFYHYPSPVVTQDIFFSKPFNKLALK